MQESKNYEFEYFLTKTRAKLEGGLLEGAFGNNKFSVVADNIRFLYVLHNKNIETKTLILVFEDSRGKPRKTRLYCESGEKSFQEMINDLVALKPEIDLRNRTKKEAYALMGMKNVTVPILIAIPFLGTALTAVFLIPLFTHGFDKGHAQVSIAQLAQGKLPKTRNLTVKGVANPRYAVKKTESRGRGGTSIYYFLPLIPADYQKGQPVHVVLKTGDVSEKWMDLIADSSEHKGILRNVWWEGLPGGVRRYFVNKHKLPMADVIYVIERDADSRMDLIVAWIALGAVFLTLALIFGISAILIIRRNAV